MTKARTFILMTTAACLLLGAATCVMASTFPVSLSWSAPQDGAPVDFYKVYWTVDGAAPRVIETVDDPSAVIQCETGVEYIFTVKAVSPYGLESVMSEASDLVFLPEQQSEGNAPPASPGFRPNYPNPFNPETQIRYGIPRDHEVGSPVVLELYDVRGQRVRTFSVDDTPGWHEVTWNGKGDDGAERPSGHYVLRLVCDAGSSTWKMTMVK